MAAGLTAVIPTFASAEGNGSSDGCWTGVTGTGTEDEMTYTAEEGDVITGVCIKSGTNMFVDGHSGTITADGDVENCYTVDGIGTDEVTVTRDGDGPNCQGISHIDVIVDEAPEPVGATVTIVKQGLAAGVTANFTTDLGAAFTATTADTTQVFSNVSAGTYFVTEAALAGYDLSSASCTGAAGGAGSLNATTNTLTFAVAAGETITCTLVNGVVGGVPPTDTFDVTIHKYVDGAAATTGTFDFTANWDEPDAPAGSGNFSLSSANSFMATTSPLTAGSSYSIVENGIDATCDAGDTYRLAGFGIGVDLATALAAPVAGTGSIANLTADMVIVVRNVSCAAQVIDFDVTIHKYVDGAAATTGTFNFTANWDEPDAPADSGNFSLSSANSFMATTSPLTAGSSYSIVENGIDATCDAGDTYRLAGFGIGIDLATALAAPVAGTGSIANLTADMVIVVRNVSCAAQVIDFDVTIHKYVDGAAATTGTFNFTANWDEPDAPADSG